MKHFAVRLLVALGISSSIGVVNSAISFGSRHAAIETTNGSFGFSNNANLNKGVLRTLGSGSFTNDASEYLACSKMKIQTKYDVTTKGMHVDGKLYINDGTLTLEDNDHLIVNGGQVSQAVTVTADSSNPAILQGSGSLANDITIADESWLKVRWQGPLNANINLAGDSTTGTAIWLEDDLWFASGYGPQATSDGRGNSLYSGLGNRYWIHLGNVTIGPYQQTWSAGRVSLFGDLTLSASITTSSSASKIEGNGNKIIISGSGGFTGPLDLTLDSVVMTDMTASCLAGNGTTYTFYNSILDDGTNKIRIIDGAIRDFNDDDYANPFSNDVSWPSGGSIELLRDLNITKKWVATAAMNISGNGHTITFTDSTGIFDYNADIAFSDVVLANVTSASFDNGASADLLMRNVEWHDGSGRGAIRIQPPLDYQSAMMSLFPGKTTAGDIFDNVVIWNIGARIELLQDCALDHSWEFGGTTHIDGNNNVLRLESGGRLDYNGDLVLSNMTLALSSSARIDNAGNKDLYLSNVTLVDEDYQSVLRIAGNTEDTTAGVAQVELAAVMDASDIYASAVNWKNGVNLELLSGLTFQTGAAWTFTKNSVINGNGQIIDLNSVSGTNPITVASGQTLKIADAIIKGWGNSDISFAGATLELVNVTIVLDGDVTLGATEALTIDGNVRFVTGSNKFNGSAANASNTLVGMTVWYDTLGTLDQNNLRLGSFSGDGRIAMMPLSEWADIVFDSGSSHVQQSMHLLYDIDVGTDAVYESLGRQLTLDNSDDAGGSFTWKGNGRTIFLGRTPLSSSTNKVGSQLITVSGSASNIVAIEDLTIEGWEQEHITDTSDVIRYANGTVLRLQGDEAVSKTIQFGYQSSGESVVLDLHGHELDLSSDTAALTITDTDATLTIKNGRLLNVSDQTGGDSKLRALGTTSTMVFQDVDLVLSGNTTLTAGNVHFKGDCTVTGTGNYELKCYHTPITVTDGARVSFGKGITLGLYGNGTSTDASISFGSNNSTLSFSRSTFDVSNLVSAPTLTHGTIRIDDIVTFDGDMTLGSSNSVLDLDVDLMPAASIEVNSGTVTYANAS